MSLDQNAPGFGLARFLRSVNGVLESQFDLARKIGPMVGMQESEHARTHEYAIRATLEAMARAIDQGNIVVNDGESLKRDIQELLR